MIQFKTKRKKPKKKQFLTPVLNIDKFHRTFEISIAVNIILFFRNNTKARFSSPVLLLLLLLSLIGAILVFLCILRANILAPITLRDNLLPQDLNHVYISSPTRFVENGKTCY